MLDSRAPWVHADHDEVNPNINAEVVWYDAASTPSSCQAPSSSIGTCAANGSDHLYTWIAKEELSCDEAPYDFGVASARAKGCGQPCPCFPPLNDETCICNFESWTNHDGIPLIITGRMLGCAPPKKDSCNGDPIACNACLGGSPASPFGAEGPDSTTSGPGVSIGGDGPGISLASSGPGARLRYQAGGVGAPGSPGWAAHLFSLGRGWSHEFAERIVLDPTTGTDDHVWLLTRFATFREFSDLGPSGDYGSASPSDEYRTLKRTIDGWELRFLDGTVQRFDEDGLWYETSDRNGNLWYVPSGGYSGGRLLEVRLPNGTKELFTYHPSGGRLASITQVGVDGSTTRTWKYFWSGQDLVTIQRPDGREWSMTYGRLDLPGYITQLRLLGTSGASRIERSWEYDDFGNAIRTWKGAGTFADTASVEKWELSFDDPSDPTETTVTDPLGGTSVYQFDRDSTSRKPRVLSIDGSCPVCGSAPNTTFAYDPAHPLRVATETSPSGTQTSYTYSSSGLVTSRIDAANETSHPHLPRITEWAYDANFPGFTTQVEGPTAVGDTPTRIVTMSYDPATGDLEDRTIEGFESTQAGGFFNLATAYSGYNGAGRVGVIDPPGYSTSDQTSFTYAVTGTNGMIPDSRTDPVVGTTQFGYDAFNRRTTTTDPNGVVTMTAYDTLDRVTSVTQGGDPSTGGDDLVTTYTYNALGDLYCIKSPSGAGLEHLYDSAGRLAEIRRGTAVTTPSATSCLTISSTNFAERRLWTLDGAGHRTNEKLDRGTATNSWTTHAETSWVYSSMCHVDQEARKIDGSTNAVTEYAYDCEGRLSSVWDPLHPRASFPAQPSTSYDYDPVDRLVAVTQRWGGAGGGTVTTSYVYDVQDHLVEVTDGEGTVTSYEYSDRDLLTEQVSEVSGTTSYEYNEHGELVEETDARAVTVSRTVDAADRVTFVDYPGSDLDVTRTWGTSGAPDCEIGRLTGITRNSQTIDFAYDCFGRVVEDGDLAYTYNAAGDRLTVSYPGSLVATYTYDRMHRPVSLSIQEGGGSPLGVVLSNPAATYKPFGPLASLRFDLTTDRNEIREYDQRYAPTSIRLQATSGSPPTQLFGWDYTTDAVGNVTAIGQTEPSSASRAYDYQDWQYFLTDADGPWGSRAWSYDRIGNRTTDATRIYEYTANSASSGNTSKLETVGDVEAPYFSDGYGFDEAGHLGSFYADRGGAIGTDPQIFFTSDASGNLAFIDHNLNEDLSLRYDGRGFLSGVLNAGGSKTYVAPTYASDGVLHSLLGSIGTSPAERMNVLYFAGRPIGIWKKVGTGTATLTRIVTDHLGTPAASIQQAGTAVDWYGGFEPFGQDWQAGTAQDSLDKGIFLRMPGQWKDAVSTVSTYPIELFYNVHRWYETGTGRYTRPDPLTSLGPHAHEYVYGESRPLFYVDPLGLCECNDQCPGGEWDYSGWGFSYALVGGIAYSRGTYTCSSNPNATVPVKMFCPMVGPIVGFGAGIEGGTPFAAAGCGCDQDDLLGKQAAVTGNAGPFAATVSGCGSGPFGVGDRTITAGVGASVGAGLAYIECDVTYRNGPWDWDFDLPEGAQP